MNWIMRFCRYVATWRKHRSVIKELNKLSDYELQDIGISRDDIDRLIWLQQDKDSRGH